MYSTSTPETRNFNAAHTYNVSASDEIGHFELCGKVKNDALGTCAKPLGADTNDKDNKGPDPEGDDVFCLPKDASLLVRIGGCLNTDGDFDGVSYDHTWPGSITNPTADHLLNGTPMMLTSPLTNGKNFDTMAFESDASRNESDDTAFDVFRFCQRHITNPADPNPGKGCVNPPPGSRFYPLYTTIEKGGTCFWQQGGTHIPGTTDTFGGSAQSEYGPLRVISYPTAPDGDDHDPVQRLPQRPTHGSLQGLTGINHEARSVRRPLGGRRTDGSQLERDPPLAPQDRPVDLTRLGLPLRRVLNCLGAGGPRRQAGSPRDLTDDLPGIRAGLLEHHEARSSRFRRHSSPPLPAASSGIRPLTLPKTPAPLRRSH